MIGEANTIGPKHVSAEESILVILKGKAVLKILNEEHSLNLGKTIIIPGGVEHILEILEDTKAIHIMPLENKIKLLPEQKSE